MNGRTQLIVGLAVVAVGIGVASLAFLDGDAGVRRVEDLLADPAGHASGRFVLLGVPQPAEVPVTAATGVVLAPNEAWSNQTSATTRWTRDGHTYFSTRTTTVALAGDQAHWTWTNETRRLPSDPQLAFPSETRTWTTSGARAFAIQAFDDGDGDTPRVWGLYAGPLKDPMQPKPSQFTGHLIATLPDGSPVPDGVYLYDVAEFKAGCSSKFLPPEEKERLERSGDL